jgi:peptidoglycan hydrolase CwlO-like protein
VKKRALLTVFISLLCIFGTSLTGFAQTSETTIHQAKEKLQQQQKIIQQQEKEKQTVDVDVHHLQDELQTIHNTILKNKEQLTKIQQKIVDTHQRIEQKKEEIVQLEEQLAARKKVMDERLVTLQHNDKTKIYLDAIFNSDSFADFVGRISAVATFMSADKDILTSQKNDLEQIENDKQEIDKQEITLEADQQALADIQVELEKNIQIRQSALVDMQNKLSHIMKKITLADNEKATIQLQMKTIQANIKHEQDEAKAAKQVSNTAHADVSKPEAGAGKELYVSATAYSYEETDGNNFISRLGYNIKNDSNLKLIAVDPSVIPLGKKVWVEGYGTAIAGDTGGAIKGYRIDVLLPSKSSALSWGRRTVKVIVLD